MSSSSELLRGDLLFPGRRLRYCWVCGGKIKRLHFETSSSTMSPRILTLINHPCWHRRRRCETATVRTTNGCLSHAHVIRPAASCYSIPFTVATLLRQPTQLFFTTFFFHFLPFFLVDCSLELLLLGKLSTELDNSDAQYSKLISVD